MARPRPPEAFANEPLFERSPERANQLNQESIITFKAVLGEPLPLTLTQMLPEGGAFNGRGGLEQLCVTAKLPRKEFRRRLKGKDWRAIPIPANYLKGMHLPPHTPRDYMACHLGQVNGKPAYLFWSDYAERIMVVVDYGMGVSP
jgi:hypothetical protein